MKADEDIEDWRSTGRKRGRAVLERSGRGYWCRSNDEGTFDTDLITLPTGRQVEVGCGRSPTDENAPGGLYPNMGALQVNHINKDITDNDEVNLEWVCPSCHKDIDSQTEKGESIKGDEYGYGLPPGVEVM